MANWCNIRLSVFGPPADVRAFRKAAGRLDEGRIKTSRSTIFLPEMEVGETGDLTAYEPREFGQLFERVEYTLQGRNDDYADYFRDISARYPALAFVITYGDPNADDHGSHLLLNGEQRLWRISKRLHHELMRKHYKRQGLVNARGHMDYDADDSDVAEWRAFLEMMNVAAAHWDAIVLRWLHKRHPGNAKETQVRRKPRVTR